MTVIALWPGSLRSSLSPTQPAPGHTTEAVGAAVATERRANTPSTSGYCWPVRPIPLTCVAVGGGFWRL